MVLKEKNEHFWEEFLTNFVEHIFQAIHLQQNMHGLFWLIPHTMNYYFELHKN